MQVTGDGEQPWAKVGVGTKSPDMHDEPEPGLFKEVFGNVPAVRQPHKEVVEAAIERIVDGIERLRIARPQTFDKLELELAIHRGTNADIAET